jgi:protoporphyrinogen/coproporphyrinogen III oxidase
MTSPDVLVVGGGISGASFAFHAARAGRSVLLVEKEPRAGGCIRTQRTASGFWYELGAHTCYNSYGAYLELIEGCGLSRELQPRGKPILRFLDRGRVVRGKNLGVLLKLFGKWELLRAVPHWLGARSEGQSVRAYYSSLVGARNYERVLRPMLSAVPSQTADAFPADMLFKKRERRKDVMRSFTLVGGLERTIQAVLGQPGIATSLGRAAVRIERSGDRFAATLDDGSRVEARALALATPPGAAASLLRGAAPEVAARVAAIGEATVDTLGFAVRASKVNVPRSTFLIPLDDVFHSIVTRDVVPDPEWRGFAIHFRPGLSREDRSRRASEVLGVRAADMEAMGERTTTLPSPVVGHADVVRDVDRLLAGQRLALCGNWFGGLAIEDCVLRSRAEWRRIAALG